MIPFRDLSIRRKLIVIILAASSVALVLACAVVVAYDQVSYRDTMADELATIANVVGNNATAALTFGDPKAAEEVLRSLRFQSHISSACIYARDGTPFARYDRNGMRDTPCPALKEDGRYFEPAGLQQFRHIRLGDDHLGFVYIESDLEEAQARLRHYVTLSLCIVLAASLVAFLLGSWLQALISQPILKLVATAREVSVNKNYSIRAAGHGQDETGLLIASFNEMLAQIQQRDEELSRQNRQLHNARETAEAMALHDPLTQLPNRSLFQDRLEQALQRARRHPEYLFAVLYLDLDRFKVVNDSLGHLAGDELLQEAGRRLQLCLRRSDTVARPDGPRPHPGGEDVVARLGGDEFTILLNEIRDVRDAIRVAERIQEQLALPLFLRGKEVSITASIGIACSAHSYTAAEEMLRDADIAMYRAKVQGRGRFVVFDEGMHVHAVERLQLETELRSALENKQLVLHYQPIVALQDGSIVGFEALLRWQSPRRGLVAPVQFVPLAEETGLIVPIGNWVMYEACRQLKLWQQRFPREDPFNVSVNISVKQFVQPDFVGQVMEALKKSGLHAGRLRLELTESVAMENAERTRKILNSLRQLGVRLSIDDFGTGYSSLDYLHRFAADTLKIDKSFVSKLTQSDEGREIVRAIVTLSRNLKLDVIAEGTETAEQVAALRGFGCQYAQGYFFFKPMAAAQLETLLEQRSAPMANSVGVGT